MTQRASKVRREHIALSWRAYEDAVLMRGSSSRGIGKRRALSVKARRNLVSKYRIQAHYLLHDCWLGERNLLALAARASAASVPLVAVHGSHDPVCPVDNVRRLARAVPAVDVRVVDAAGHLLSAPSLAAAMKAAIEALFLR
jgi:proline iminopeptidase